MCRNASQTTPITLQYNLQRKQSIIGHIIFVRCQTNRRRERGKLRKNNFKIETDEFAGSTGKKWLSGKLVSITHEKKNITQKSCSIFFVWFGFGIFVVLEHEKCHLNPPIWYTASLCKQIQSECRTLNNNNYLCSSSQCLIIKMRAHTKL